MKRQIAQILTAIIMILVFFGGVCCLGYVSRNTDGEWFKVLNVFAWHWKDAPQRIGTAFALNSDGETLYADGSYPMPENMVITAQAPTGSDETPTCGAVFKADKAEYEFTVQWRNASSDWATGKTTDGYVTLEKVYGETVFGIGALPEKKDRFYLSYKQPFGEPMEITAKTKDGQVKKMQVECLRRLNCDVSKTAVGGSDVDDEANLEIKVDYGAGTVNGVATVKSVYLSLDCEFMDKVKSYLTFDIAFKGYKFSPCANAEYLEVDSGKYFVIADGTLKYEMFISGFAEQSQEVKDAIYFAWYKAYTTFGSYSNLLVDFEISYTYGGAEAYKLAESDIVGSAVTGDLYGNGLQPNELNKHVW